MSAGRPMIQNNQVNAAQLNTGDTLLLGESLTAGIITTIGAGTLTAAAMVSGIITRSGPVGAYIDTTDTAANIILALAGNAATADVLPGSTFRMRYINTVAQAMTLAAGTGVTLDNTNGSAVTTVAASTVRDYLLTVNNAQPAVTVNCGTTNGNKVLTFVLAAGRTSRVMGPNGGGDITPGMVVSGAGITAGTKVLGVTLGQGGSIGVVTDTNSTATVTVASGGTPITFGPSVTISSLGGGMTL